VDSGDDPVDLTLYFELGVATVSCDKYTWYPWPDDTEALTMDYVGDFSVSISGEPEENLITGEVVSNFLDKKTIELKMFDTRNWNYRNTLLTDKYGINYYTFKINGFTWGVADPTPPSLADTLLESKFRLYRVARQMIRMGNYRVNIDYQMRPLQIWLDDNQAYKTFALVEDIHEPDQDKHTVVLFEYDGSEEVNLVG